MAKCGRRTAMQFHGLKSVAKGRGLGLWFTRGAYHVTRDGERLLETGNLQAVRAFIVTAPIAAQGAVHEAGRAR